MKKLPAILFLFVLCFSAKGQSVHEVKTKLSDYQGKIAYWDVHRYDSTVVDGEDSLDKVNNDLANYLVKTFTNNKSTLTADFQKTVNTISIISDDYKLRLFSWDTRMGGTMRLYSDMAQYQTYNGSKVVDMKDTSVEGDYGSDYRSITIIHTKSGKTVYLVKDYSIVSTKDRAESITAYVIENDLLKKFGLFHTKTKVLNSIGYGYDAFASAYKLKDKDIPTIHLNKDKQKLYIPIVGGPTGEDVTEKFLVYVFDGNNYVFDKNAK